MSEILFTVIFVYLLSTFLFPYQYNNSKIGTSDSWISWEISKRILVGNLLCLAISIITIALVTRINLNILFALFFLFFIHILLDFIYSYAKTFKFEKNNTLYIFNCFLVFQLLHLVGIVFSLKFFNLIPYTFNEIRGLIGSFLFNKELALSDLDKVLLIGSSVILTTYFSAHLLRILLTPLLTDNRYVEKKVETTYSKGVKGTIDMVGNLSTKSGQSVNLPQKLDQGIEEEHKIIETTTEIGYELPKFEIGRYIGLVERFVILLLVVNNAFTGLTFLIALKALTRFKQFEDKSFAEYYLIGNLLSILFGIIGGSLIVLILTSP